MITTKAALVFLSFALGMDPAPPAEAPKNAPPPPPQAAPAAAPEAPKNAPPPAAATPEGAKKPNDVSRWNDRTSPRKMLETFYFAIVGYDRNQALIVNAIDCLDLTGLDPEMRERDAALLAHQLEFILNRQGIPLYSVPERPTSDRVVLDEIGGQPIVVVKQPDGLWRFDAETVGKIGRLRKLANSGLREAEEARAKMAEGRTDPAATMRSFAIAAYGHRDFALAARCLDLRDVPPKLRASEGAQMARKLAFVMQRCGFQFSQEVPNDPYGYRYVWHSNHRGRIMLERVRTPEGQDAWLFSRGTIRNLDALVEGFRPKAPDQRYATIGVMIGEDVLTAGGDAHVPAPAGVPAGLGSPRKVLRTFQRAMDELQFKGEESTTLLSCLDLKALAEEDRVSIGLRLAAKLEAVLMRLGIDLLTIPDGWDADPQILGRDTEWQLTLTRGRDGAWRFDSDTVARIPDLFERLTPEEKAARERLSNFHSAQQTMRTLLHAVEVEDLPLASRCLDLDGIPPAARDELGPILAYKLKAILDRIGRVAIEEIPSEDDGPRYYYHRGPLGHIDLVRRTAEPRVGDWQFSRDTVAKIEAMYRDASERRASTILTKGDAAHAPPPWDLVPSLWLRSQLPSWMKLPTPGLDLYQWLGLVLALLTASAISWFGLRIVERVACYLLRRGGFEIERGVVAIKLKPLSYQLGLWSFYFLLRLLDLPAGVVGYTLPAVKIAWLGLMGWTAIRLIDLGMLMYSRSERLHDRRSLSDMIVPTAANGLKLAALLVTISCQVYLVGSSETLTQLLAGLGLVGLAASLAAQDTLKNFFGTLLLIGEHPFRIGDHVAVQGNEGTIESVGFRSTRVRTFEDSLLTIPNSVMASALIDNRAARTCRRYRTVVSLAYGTPLDKMLAMRDALRTFARNHPRFHPDKVEVHIGDLKSSSVDIFIQVFLRVSNFTDEMGCRDELTREILRQADALGIEIAFPTQTIHLAGQAEKAHELPPAPKHLIRDRAEPARPAH